MSKFADLFRPSGEVDRKTYVLVGAVAFFLKNNLDRLVAGLAFHRYWGFFNYWVPIEGVRHLTQLGRSDAAFLATMIAVALPFVWLGVAMTLKRLRSAGLAPGLVVFFFFPFVNLLFFLALALWPEKDDNTFNRRDRGEKHEIAESWAAKVVPDSAMGSAAASLLITVPAGLLMAVLASRFLVTYGWGLFVALPFVMGFSAAVTYGVRRPRSMKACVGVACLSVAVLGVGLLAFAVEGLVCLLMAIPIALPLAAFGGIFGYFVQRWRWSQAGAPAFLCVLMFSVPALQLSEHVAPGPHPEFVVRSAVEINVPPEKVWNQVIAFSEIPPPKEWIFRTGIAYPMRAEIAGHGPGAERHCVFSTGAFVEPIETWDEPRLLKFSVSANPPPMEEWTPYAHLDTPHLHGFLVSNGGQFLLTPLPNGGTRLEGTTWYRHGLAPAEYWRVWSDLIIHKIHMRVLNHIKQESEK
jgi:hypothetical protein